MKKLVLFTISFLFSILSIYAQRVNKLDLPEVRSENGHLVFTDLNAYNQAIEFTLSADESELTEWRNSFDIQTSSKVLAQFETRAAEINSEEELAQLEKEYEGLIKISSDNETGKNYEPKYHYLSELVNNDGLFQVGKTIVKVTDTKIISLTQPEKVDLSSISDKTETDNSIGIFVVFASAVSADCCPSTNSIEKKYNNNNNRLTADYEVFNASIVFFNDFFKQFEFDAVLAVKAKGFNDKRKKFIVSWWGCDDKNLTESITTTFFHSYSKFGIPNPLSLQAKSSVTSKCKITSGDANTKIFQVGSNFVIPNANICVTEVTHILTNNTDKVNITDTCKK